ncbi:MAG: hypothetical protein HY717_09220 [Planctomycetes bacterium]|nr:hypothetical protein [Planctomycetota bacterium]
MPAPISIIEFVKDPNLLGLEISPAQEVLLRSIYGLPLEGEAQLQLFRECTGRAEYHPPIGGWGEATVIAGARSGKDSRIAAPVVLFEALFGAHERHLGKGERAVIPLVAQDARATRIAFDYIKGYLLGSQLLAAQVADIRSLEIELTNGASIFCFPCSLKSLRGWTIPVGIMDEVSFYRLEWQADSDVEVQASIRRGMIGFPATRLVKISTPYMKAGVIYEDFRSFFGRDSADILVWKAASTLMNPSLSAERLEREKRLDPMRYAREYLGEFSDDIAAFLPADWIEGALVPGRFELPPRPGVPYIAAVDPSGGGADAFTLAVVHTELTDGGLLVVQDAMKGWSRQGSQNVDLEGIVKEIARIVKNYGLSSVIGDRYAGGWVRERFRAEGLHYEESPIDKSAAYLETEPLFAQGRIQVLDHSSLIRELRNLERRPRPGGKTIVDHPRGGHDDHSNVLALAAARASKAGALLSRNLVLAALDASLQPLFPVAAEASP